MKFPAAFLSSDSPKYFPMKIGAEHKTNPAAPQKYFTMKVWAIS